MTTQEPPRLRVRNWDRWQSYRRDRGQPPWIKVHRCLMRDPEWVSLNDAQRGQLVAIWLLAADRDGVIPASPGVIRKLCYMDDEPDLIFFVNQGFLEADANLTSQWRQHDSPETETETETEGRAGARVNSKKGAKMPDLPPWLPTDVWDEWVQHRREIGHTLKPTTIKAQFGKLERLRDQGHQPADVIRHSIEGGYQGLFAPKGEKPNGPIRSDGNPEHWT